MTTANANAAWRIHVGGGATAPPPRLAPPALRTPRPPARVAPEALPVAALGDQPPLSPSGLPPAGGKYRVPAPRAGPLRRAAGGAESVARGGQAGGAAPRSTKPSPGDAGARKGATKDAKRKAKGPHQKEAEAAPEGGEDESEVLEVEKVVAQRAAAAGGGGSEYKVRWKGYSARDDTWQTAADLQVGPPARPLRCLPLASHGLDRRRQEAHDSVEAFDKAEAAKVAKAPKAQAAKAPKAPKEEAAKIPKAHAAKVPKAAKAPNPANDAGWELSLAKLKAYKAEHGDCNVPHRWAEDQRLGRWVGDQRAGKRKVDRGEPSRGMTVARAAKLEALGFAWAVSAATPLTKEERVEAGGGVAQGAGCEGREGRAKARGGGEGGGGLRRGHGRDGGRGRRRDQAGEGGGPDQAAAILLDPAHGE